MQDKKTEQGYYIIVDREELLQAARAKGHENVLLCKDEYLPDENIQIIRASGKSAVFVSFYDGKCEHSGFSELYDRLKEYNVPDVNIDLSLSEETLEAAIEGFPDVREVERYLISDGYMLDTDYTSRCGNCHAYMDEADKFCRYCGTRKGKGRFLPFENIAYCVYGPPNEIRYICKVCGHRWRYSMLGSPEESGYCPECGSDRIRKAGYKQISWDEMFRN